MEGFKMMREVFFMWCSNTEIAVQPFNTWVEAEEYRKKHGGYVLEGHDPRGRRPKVKAVIPNRIKI